MRHNRGSNKHRYTPRPHIAGSSVPCLQRVYLMCVCIELDFHVAATCATDNTSNACHSSCAGVRDATFIELPSADQHDTMANCPLGVSQFRWSKPIPVRSTHRCTHCIPEWIQHPIVISTPTPGRTFRRDNLQPSSVAGPQFATWRII